MRMRQYPPMFPRTALVTGGASGIGAAIVDAPAQRGRRRAGARPRRWVRRLGSAGVGGRRRGRARMPERRRHDRRARLTAAARTTRTAASSERTSTASSSAFAGWRTCMEPGSAIVATASLAGLVPSPRGSDLHAHEARGDRLRPQRRAATRGAGDTHQRGRARLRRDAADRRRAVSSPPASRCSSRDAVAQAVLDRGAQRRDRPGLGRAARAANRCRSASRTCRARATRRAGASAPRLDRSS